MASFKFQATLESAGNKLFWTIVRIPEKFSKSLKTRGQARVKGTINGFEFRSSLFPDGEGHHILLVNKTMQKGAAASAGATARLEIEADTEKRSVEVPPELLRALRQDKAVLRYFEGLSNSFRKDIARWVGEAKQQDTRLRRSTEIAERLMQVMDGEHEPPPVCCVLPSCGTRVRAKDGNCYHHHTRGLTCSGSSITGRRRVRRGVWPRL